MPTELKRSIRTPGAVLMGLGSIIGTGLFVSIAIATQFAGDGIIFAILIAGAVATLNGLNSAQLAAAYPVSGGTYEYGYRVLGSYWGFTAGWMFLVAKSASAATAVLGSAGYLLFLFGLDVGKTMYVGTGILILLIVLLLVSGGIRRSNQANTLIVGITLAGLAILVVSALLTNGIPSAPVLGAVSGFEMDSLLYASALMFVAFTGYGRIATLGEEVVNPSKTIPRAIILSMGCIMLIYISVALVSLDAMGWQSFAESIGGEGAPLMMVARALSVPGLFTLISIAAVTAMLGVLLNLILGLSRVMLGMARRNDLPAFIGHINPKNQSPAASVWMTGFLIAVLALSGNLTFTWSFSAFTVLIYYAITNLSAWYLPQENRLYPRWIAAAGFISCVTLAFWIEPGIWLPGTGLIVAGLIWHHFARKISGA